MRRASLLALVTGLIVVALLVATGSPGTLAQETATATATPAGVTFEPVAEGAAPPVVADSGVKLEWARFAPGAGYTVPAEDDGLILVTVAAGSLTVRSSAPLVVNRAASVATAGAGAHELVAAGIEVTLGPGDSFIRPIDSSQELSNEGTEPAVALTGSITPQLLAGSAEKGAAVPARGAGLVVALAVVLMPECPEGYNPAAIHPMATPGGGGGGGGAGGVAMAIAAAPECVGPGAGHTEAAGTPTP